MAYPGPDQASRSQEGLARIFEHFGRIEVPLTEEPLYQSLCVGIAADPDLLAIAALTPATQPAPNLILAAVHYLLLKGARHPIREYYPALASGDSRAAVDPSGAIGAFRDFCMTRRGEIERIVMTRRTQTNVIQRCTFLLPAFSEIFRAGGERPLALIEIGPSAGLNLQWNRFRYEYWNSGDARVSHWGEEGARVVVDSELREGLALPELADSIPVAWRRGVEIEPIDLSDDDALLWLRALIWPGHVGRQERLTHAIQVARADPPEIVAGDASQTLPDVIADAPADTTLCVFGTHTLYQFPKLALRAVLKGMQAASAARPIWFLSCEGTGDRCSELRQTRYRDGQRDTRLLARCSPHGRWIEWLGGDNL